MTDDDNTLQAALKAARERQAEAQKVLETAKAAKQRGEARSKLASQRLDAAQAAIADHQARSAKTLRDSLRSGAESADALVAPDETLSLRLVGAQSEIGIAQEALNSLDTELSAALKKFKETQSAVAAADTAIVVSGIREQLARRSRLEEMLTSVTDTLRGFADDPRLPSDVQQAIANAIARRDEYSDSVNMPVNKLAGFPVSVLQAWHERAVELKPKNPA